MLKKLSFPVVVSVLLILSGCGSAADNDAPIAGQFPNNAYTTATSQQSGPCTLLTVDEVTSVMEPVLTPKPVDSGMKTIDACQFDAVKEDDYSGEPKFTVKVGVYDEKPHQQQFNYYSKKQVNGVGDQAWDGSRYTAGQRGFLTEGWLGEIAVQKGEKFFSIEIRCNGHSSCTDVIKEDTAQQLGKIAAEKL